MKKLLLIILLLPSFAFGQGANGKDIANRATGGSISVDSVNALSKFNLKQTTAGQTIIVSNLTVTAKDIEVRNKGTVSVTMSPGGVLDTAKFFTYAWMGNKWAVCGGGSGGAADTSDRNKVNVFGDTMTGDLHMGGNKIRNPLIYDNSNVLSISPDTRLLKDASGNSIAIWGSRSSGFGINTNNWTGYIKNTNLTTNRTFENPDQSGTYALTSDIPASVDTSLLGHVAKPLSQFASTTSLQLKNTISDETGSGPLVFGTSPTLTTPALGTPSALVGTNITGTASGFTAGNVTTNANLTGEVTSVGNAATLTNSAVIGKVLTGYSSGSGTVASTDNILQAIQKLNGNEVVDAANISTNTTNIATNTASILLKQNTLFDSRGNINLNPLGSGYVNIFNIRGIASFAKVNPGVTLFSFGDSFTVGQGATTTAHNYVNILNDYLGTTTSNQGVGGRGWYQAIVNGYTNLKSSNVITPSTVMVGLNDWRRGGVNAKTYAKGQSCARAFFANHFLTSAVAANDASVTTTGTWTTTSGIGDKASLALSGLVRQSVVSGSTLSWTFTGETLVIGTFSTDEVTSLGGDFTYAIDGGTSATYTGKSKTDGISDGLNANTIVPNAVIVQNLGTGSHTVIVTTNSTASTKIDYFGTINNPQSCAPVIISSTPKMTTAGYAVGGGNTPPNNLGSDAIYTAADSNIRNVISEFVNYPIYWVDINKYFVPATDTISDNVHPNNLGHSHIANGFLSAIEYGKGYQTQNPIGITDNSASANMGWIGNSTDILTIGMNRRPLTAVFYNTAKASSLIQLTGATSDGHINFFTTSSNNTTPTQRMVIDKAGLIGIGQSTPLYQLEIAGSSSSQIRFGSSTSDNGGFLLSNAASQSIMCGGAAFNGSNTVAKATSSSQIGCSTGAILFKCDTTLTISNTFTPTERARISPSGKFGIGLSPTKGWLEIKAGTTTIAPLAFTRGSLVTTAAQGLFGYGLNGRLFFSPSTTWKSIPVSDTASAGNGKILIGNGTDYTVANITQGINTIITNGSGTITIDADTTAGTTKLATQGDLLRIPGTTTNNSAATGNTGEEINSVVSTYTNYTTTATYQNIASITLTAGDWDISAFITYSSNSATITAASNAIAVISTTTASAAGSTEGQNILYIPQAALLGTSKFSDAIAPYRVSLSGTTTYYLNSQATFTIGNPQYVGRIRARRMR